MKVQLLSVINLLFGSFTDSDRKWQLKTVAGFHAQLGSCLKEQQIAFKQPRCKGFTLCSSSLQVYKKNVVFFT